MKIVFVCTGNTCRSSMAEGLAKKWLLDNAAGRADIQVRSAGIAAIQGSPASPHSIRVMAQKGIPIDTHRAARFSADTAETSDLILTMTSGHKQVLMNMYPSVVHKVFTLAEFASGTGRDICDPFGQSEDVYRNCSAEISELIERAFIRILNTGLDFIGSFGGK